MTSVGEASFAAPCSSIPTKNQRVILKQPIALFDSKQKSKRKLQHDRNHSHMLLNQTDSNATFVKRNSNYNLLLPSPSTANFGSSKYLNQSSTMVSDTQDYRQNPKLFRDQSPSLIPPESTKKSSFGVSKRFSAQQDVDLIFGSNSPGPLSYKVVESHQSIQNSPTIEKTILLNKTLNKKEKSISPLKPFEQQIAYNGDLKEPVEVKNVNTQNSIQKFKQCQKETVNRVDQLPSAIKLKAISLAQGVRFSSVPRFEHKKDKIPGPADYEIEDDKNRKQFSLVKMTNPNQIEVPASIAKNPVNAEKPIVISIYQKKDIPGVGTYKIKHPEDIGRRAKMSDNKFSYRSIFKPPNNELPETKEMNEIMKANQEYNLAIAGGARSNQVEEPTEFYDVNLKFEKQHIKSPSFNLPQRKELKLNDDKLIQIKAQTLLKEKLEADKRLQERLKEQSLERKRKEEEEEALAPTGNFILNNKDRFGQPLLPKAPAEQRPEVGIYDPKPESIKPKPPTIVINPKGQGKDPLQLPSIGPGPAKYDQNFQDLNFKVNTKSYHYWEESDGKQPWLK